MQLLERLKESQDGRVTETLNREDVAELLDADSVYENQRALDLKHVADLADVMKQGEWLPEAATLMFALNGDGRLRLVDGQHRLNAYRVGLEDESVEPFIWAMQVVTGDASTVYGRLDALAKKRTASVVANTVGLHEGMQSLISVCFSAANFGMIYLNGGASAYTYQRIPGAKPQPRTVPYRDRERWVKDRLAQFLTVAGLMQKVPAVYRAARTVLRNARVLPLMVETLRYDSEAEARWRSLLHEGMPPDLFSPITVRRQDEKGRAWLHPRRIAAAWIGQKTPTRSDGGRPVVINLAEGVRPYDMTLKERRRRGLCIDCEAPATHNPTLPSARALAISEGRGLTSDAHRRGHSIEQLTTHQRCEKCMEKRNKCQCGKEWKEVGRQRCRPCLDAHARRSVDRYARRIEKGLCGRCGSPLPVEGRGTWCRRVRQAKSRS